MSELTCPECGAEMELRYSQKYQRRFFGCSQYPACNGTHGAHPDGTPMGKPADKATKAWRMKAHAAFDQLWKSGLLTRGQAYQWLQVQMVMTPVECHIGYFDADQCRRVVELCEAELKPAPIKCHRVKTEV